ncbi:MAG: hydroxymethylbilane synthase [Bacteroidetes bacterium]|nr:MAG: hydroxymethylbilane synthase [Bacteroidota bacterium]
MKQKLIIGTRSSKLALWQAEYIKGLLQTNYPELEIELKHIKTKGDEIPDVSLDKLDDKGIFTKEIENELLSGTIDIAIHSLKDLQTELPGGLKLGAVPERHRVEDVLIAREKGTAIEDLSINAVIATGSVRRTAQLLHIRPDLQIRDIRGNVNTRIDKFLKSDWDGLVLAAAGVERLGLEQYISSYIPTEIILPAVGQGALGIEIREEDLDTENIVKDINHQQTYIAITAERTFLKALGGGCKTPIAALGNVIGDELILEGMVASVDGKNVIRKKLTGNINSPEKSGEKLASEFTYKMI